MAIKQQKEVDPEIAKERQKAAEERKIREKEKKQEEKKKQMAEMKQGVVAMASLFWEFTKRGDIIWMLLTATFSAINGAIPLLFYLIFGDIIAVASEPNSTDLEVQSKINNLALNLLWVAIGAGASQFFYQLFGGIAQTRIGALLRRKYFGTLVEQELAFFDKEKTGELMNHLSEGVTKVETAMGTSLPKIAEFVVQCIAGLVLGFVHSWLMALLLLAATPIIFVVMMIVGSAQGVFMQMLQKKSDESAAHVTELVGSMKTVRTMGGEVKELQRFNHRLYQIDIIGGTSAFATGLSFGVIFFLIWALCAYAFYMGGILVVDGINGIKVDFADMMKVFGFMLLAVMGVAQAIQPAIEIGQAFIANTKLYRVINRTPAIQPHGGSVVENFKGEIEFRNVSFAYPTHPDTIVLKNFSHTFKAGQKIALVGPSGSGKSTIVSLIARFYDPIEGDIFIDGVNLKDIDPVWLHRVVGMVTQEPTLFHDTIRNNIKYSVAKSMKRADLNEISEDQIISASKAANAHDFIMDLVNQYGTMIGERGTSLSGGQKQRVAIARAMLQDPSILLLDEATSALDSESEQVVQDALDKLQSSNNRTTIAIAHRLSTIQDSDEILVFVQGVLSEKGNHEELIAQGGIYAGLATKQRKTSSKSSLDSQDDE